MNKTTTIDASCYPNKYLGFLIWRKLLRVVLGEMISSQSSGLPAGLKSELFLAAI